ncbi:hypothetical protein SISSUDRAFT_1062854 [Sistotremastrum suecicum HHB10207 ss-3]|uniref:Cupin type-2 domain-containing protein n=1 Tax=Sistotremastrum suecicum HHB10207 ss-3 TaxID=1314776 RepID=A0A166CFD8_9AGAM|nr:hypothetical protein SISSUDRAFT_1062854 [Sistotremastrum suecicum HHB10207 ss-3]
MSESAPNKDLPTNRRIVNTHDHSGNVVAQDEPLPFHGISTLPGLESAFVWTTSETPSTDNNKGPEYDGNSVPLPGLRLVSENGTNCRYTDLVPGGYIPRHRTSSVDYNVLLFGTLISILPDGSETVLHPGDVVVQRGTAHAWRNPGPNWARWVSILVHAEPAKAVDGEPLADFFDEKKDE